jgi:LDH2 family malate/lactate/ureidoglycolate dehydrogenase
MPESMLSDEAIAASWDGVPRFAPEQVREQAESLFRAYGLSAEDAARAADPLLAADWRGVESHGVARLRSYGDSFKAGTIIAEAPLTIDRESPVSVAYNANDGCGLVQAPKAMARCIEKARETGLCMVTVRDSNHYGIAGYYAMMASDAGLVGLSMTNTGSLAAPTFGAVPMMGSNPLAFATPTGDGSDPIVLDMSTSTVAYGKIEIAQRARKPLPAGWAIDKAGYPTTDPFSVGAILPLGGDRETCGHKGYGLGMLVDILCGPLAAGNWSKQISDDYYAGRPARVGHFFAAWRIDAFRDPEEYAADLRAVVDELHRTPVAPGAPSDRVLVPGEPEAAQYRYNERHGLPVRHTVLAEIRKTCDEWNVPFLLDAPEPASVAESPH